MSGSQKRGRVDGTAAAAPGPKRIKAGGAADGDGGVGGAGGGDEDGSTGGKPPSPVPQYPLREAWRVEGPWHVLVRCECGLPRACVYGSLCSMYSDMPLSALILVSARARAVAWFGPDSAAAEPVAVVDLPMRLRFGDDVMIDCAATPPGAWEPTIMVVGDAVPPDEIDLLTCFGATLRSTPLFGEFSAADWPARAALGSAYDRWLMRLAEWPWPTTGERRLLHPPDYADAPALYWVTRYVANVAVGGRPPLRVGDALSLDAAYATALARDLTTPVGQHLAQLRRVDVRRALAVDVSNGQVLVADSKSHGSLDGGRGYRVRRAHLTRIAGRVGAWRGGVMDALDSITPLPVELQRAVVAYAPFPGEWPAWPYAPANSG